MSAITILLIDDDEDDRMLFKEALKEIDPALLFSEALNGLDGLKLLRSAPAPDIIFLDLNMPMMNGYECLAEVKKEERFKMIPVVIYSTIHSEAEAKRLLQMGADYFLTKPNDYAVLIKDIEKVLGLMFKGEDDKTQTHKLP